jgi:hypothetical protein
MRYVAIEEGSNWENGNPVGTLIVADNFDDVRSIWAKLEGDDKTYALVEITNVVDFVDNGMIIRA